MKAQKNTLQKCLFVLLLCALFIGIIPPTQTSAASIKLNKTTLSMARYHTYRLKVNGTPKKVTWSSSNKTVASVNSKGTVTANAEGKATIKATVAGKKLSCKVTVTDYAPLEELAAYGYAAAMQLFGKNENVKISDMCSSAFMDNTEFAYFKCTYTNNNGLKSCAYFYVYERETESALQLNMNTKRYGNLVIQIDASPMEKMMADRSNALDSSRVLKAYKSFKTLEKPAYTKGSQFDDSHAWMKLWEY